MKSTQEGLLNRPLAAVAAIGSSYVAVLSWQAISRHSAFPRSPISIFGLLFAIFITASLTYRSRLLGDRLVFGAVTAALVSAGLTAVLSSNPLAILVVVTTKSLMWTTAAIASVIVLVRGFLPGRQ
jgi:hypothetical protein